MSAPDLAVRDAAPADGAACAAIYAPYVERTAITFESVPPTAAEMAERIAAAQRAHAWLLLTSAEGAVVGYAYAGPHKARPAYRWAAEVSVYLDRTWRGRGGGRLLYEALLRRLQERGYRTATAAMTLPNPASEALHLALGFERVGVYRRIGHKLGAWHDTALFQLDLGGTDPPAEPR